MSNLIEVVFEGVAKGCAVELFLLLVLGSENKSGLISAEEVSFVRDTGFSVEEVEKVVRSAADAAILVNVGVMRFEGVFLPRVQVRLIKYGSLCDIDFNFDSSEFEDADIAETVKQLHAFATKLSMSYDVSSFYCGIEPASDEETRYFTNEEMGPLP